MKRFKEYKIIKQDELEERAKFWKYTLGLDDWHIVFQVLRRDFMAEKDCSGLCQYRVVAKQATITLLDPIDWTVLDFDQDMDKILVHELLHCKFALIDSDDSVRDVVQHRLLEELAVAIVLAYRSDR